MDKGLPRALSFWRGRDLCKVTGKSHLGRFGVQVKQIKAYGKAAVNRTFLNKSGLMAMGFRKKKLLTVYRMTQ